MRRFFVFILLATALIFSSSLARAQSANPTKGEIKNIGDGDAVRGLVGIEGTTGIEGALSWELAFGYADDTTGTWFLINEGEEPVKNGTLTNWDTSTITDGTYNLRLTILFDGNRRSHLIIQDVRIRNYTPIETDTPTPTITSTPFTITPFPSQTPTITQIPTNTPVADTPTPLPTNPVEISSRDINNSLARGAAGVMALFIVAGLYATIKKNFRK